MCQDHTKFLTCIEYNFWWQKAMCKYFPDFEGEDMGTENSFIFVTS